MTGETAVWRTQDAGFTWEPVWETAGGGFTDIDVSPDFETDDRVCALEPNGLSCSFDHGDSWVRTTVPTDTFRISVGAEGRLWAIVRGEGLYLSPDNGESWSLVGFEGDDLTAVAELSGGLMMVAEADQAGWRSTDAGETWAFVDILKVEVDQTPDGVNFFEFAQGPDGAVYLVCWYGLAISYDAGLTFAFFNTEPIQNTHSVTLTEGADGALLAWTGTYGGGPLLTNLDDLSTFTFPTLTKRFTRNTPATMNWHRDGTAIFDEGYVTLSTRDYGETWVKIASDEVDGQMELDEDIKGIAIAPDAQVDPFVVAVVGQSQMAFWTSDDLGANWTVGEQSPPCEEPAFAVGISPRWPVESRAWGACGGAVYETLDRGLTWTALGDTGAWVFDIAERMDGVLLVATSEGLWRMDADATTRIGFEDTLIVSVAASTQAGDDTVFALVPTEGWMRSDDGGETWTTLPAPTADLPRMVSMSPTFAQDGTVAVAGHGGAWASTDRGDSWFSIYTVEVYESAHDAWAFTGSWEHTDWEGASSGEVMVTDEIGASRTLNFRGIAATVEAPADAEAGVVAVWLDDRPVEQALLPATDGNVWHAEDLEDTWHTIRVEAVSGTVTFDDLHITRLEAAPTGKASGCGCRDASPADALLLMPLFWVRRTRSRRYNNSAHPS